MMFGVMKMVVMMILYLDFVNRFRFGFVVYAAYSLWLFVATDVHYYYYYLNLYRYYCFYLMTMLLQKVIWNVIIHTLVYNARDCISHIIPNQMWLLGVLMMMMIMMMIFYFLVDRLVRLYRYY